MDIQCLNADGEKGRGEEGVYGLEAESRADDLADGNGVLGASAPLEGGRVGGVGEVTEDRDTFVEGRYRGKANPALFVGRVSDGHGRGIHHIQNVLGIRREARGKGKLEGGARRGRTRVKEWRGANRW